MMEGATVLATYVGLFIIGAILLLVVLLVALLIDLIFNINYGRRICRWLMDKE